MERILPEPCFRNIETQSQTTHQFFGLKLQLPSRILKTSSVPPAKSTTPRHSWDHLWTGRALNKRAHNFTSDRKNAWKPKEFRAVRTKNPATRNRTRDHLIAAALYSQMLYQLSYSRLAQSDCEIVSAGATPIASIRECCDRAAADSRNILSANSNRESKANRNPDLWRRPQ